MSKRNVSLSASSSSVQNQILCQNGHKHKCKWSCRNIGKAIIYRIKTGQKLHTYVLLMRTNCTCVFFSFISAPCCPGRLRQMVNFIKSNEVIGKVAININVTASYYEIGGFFVCAISVKCCPSGDSAKHFYFTSTPCEYPFQCKYQRILFLFVGCWLLSDLFRYKFRLVVVPQSLLSGCSLFSLRSKLVRTLLVTAVRRSAEPINSHRICSAEF